MRISDWSSDVCSSDLVRLWPVRISLRSCQRAAALHGSEPVLQSMVEEDDFPRGGPNWHGSRDAGRITCRSQPCPSGSIASIHRPRSGLLLLAPMKTTALVLAGQLGRSSCRERVGQSV